MGGRAQELAGACRASARHRAYEAGGRVRAALKRDVVLGPFPEETAEAILAALRAALPGAPADAYVPDVALPEALARLVQHMEGVSFDAAELLLRTFHHQAA